MKSLFIIFSLLLVNNSMSVAQCNKKVVLTASETTCLDSSGTVKRTASEKSVVRINPTDVIINVNDEHETKCPIKSATCNWSIPFKQGKTSIKAIFTKEGEEKNITIDIEGKEGKITLLFKMEEEPNEIIKVVMDKFEEEKG
ncbi:MAG: hypothetical protein ABIN89_10080 [Chitinophagaceae bacterium]